MWASPLPRYSTSGPLRGSTNGSSLNRPSTRIALLYVSTPSPGTVFFPEFLQPVSNAPDHCFTETNRCGSVEFGSGAAANEKLDRLQTTRAAAANNMRSNIGCPSDARRVSPSRARLPVASDLHLERVILVGRVVGERDLAFEELLRQRVFRRLAQDQLRLHDLLVGGVLDRRLVPGRQ